MRTLNGHIEQKELDSEDGGVRRWRTPGDCSRRSQSVRRYKLVEESELWRHHRRSRGRKLRRHYESRERSADCAAIGPNGPLGFGLAGAAAMRALLGWLKADPKRRKQRTRQQGSHHRSQKCASQHRYSLPRIPIPAVIWITISPKSRQHAIGLPERTPLDLPRSLSKSEQLVGLDRLDGLDEAGGPVNFDISNRCSAKTEVQARIVRREKAGLAH